jgi:hypothetical protein
MYERLTDRARKAMQLSELEAKRLNHPHVGSEHILLGLNVEISNLKRLKESQVFDQNFEAASNTQTRIEKLGEQMDYDAALKQCAKALFGYHSGNSDAISTIRQIAQAVQNF